MKNTFIILLSIFSAPLLASFTINERIETKKLYLYALIEEAVTIDIDGELYMNGETDAVIAAMKVEIGLEKIKDDTLIISVIPMYMQDTATNNFYGIEGLDRINFSYYAPVLCDSIASNLVNTLKDFYNKVDVNSYIKQ